MLELELEDFGALVVSWFDEVEPLVEPLAEPEPCAEELSLLDGAGAAELDDEDDGGVAVEPEPAEPLIVELDEELPGAVDGEALSLLMSTEVDEDDEPAGARVAPDGAVVLEALERSAVRSQAAINEAPSARETATAIVESLMSPPWLGYRYWAARIGPGVLHDHQARPRFQFFGFVSLLWGPAASPFCWKSRCCAFSFGSTWPWVGFAPSLFSAALGVPVAEDVVPDVVVEPLADEGAVDDVSVFGDGGVVVCRLQPAANASETASAIVNNFISSLRVLGYPEDFCNPCTIPAP